MAERGIDARLPLLPNAETRRKMRRVGLISDTHGKLRPQVFSLFDGVDAILHAGDIGSVDILDELRTIAPVYAVHGNTDDFDVRAVAPESIAVELGGKLIVIAHGHLLQSTKPKHLRAAFPACDVIIYGHTHVALVDDSEEPMLINPGAAGPARFKVQPSVAILELRTLEVQLLHIDS